MRVDPVGEGGRGENKDHRPKKVEIMVTTCKRKSRYVHVRANPGKDDISTTVTVVISLLRCSITVLLLRRRLVREGLTGRGPELVDILACGRELDLHNLLAIGVLNLLRPAKIFSGTVIALGSPAQRKLMK